MVGNCRITECFGCEGAFKAHTAQLPCSTGISSWGSTIRMITQHLHPWFSNSSPLITAFTSTKCDSTWESKRLTATEKPRGYEEKSYWQPELPVLQHELPFCVLPSLSLPHQGTRTNQHSYLQIVLTLAQPLLAGHAGKALKGIKICRNPGFKWPIALLNRVFSLIFQYKFTVWEIRRGSNFPKQQEFRTIYALRNLNLIFQRAGISKHLPACSTHKPDLQSWLWKSCCPRFRTHLRFPSTELVSFAFTDNTWRSILTHPKVTRCYY